MVRGVSESMKSGLGKGNERFLYRAVCLAAVAVVSLPLACNYIMDGGIVAEWIERVREMAGDGFRLFPSADVFLHTGIRNNEMDSNLWFFLPGMLYRLSHSMVLAYRVFVLLAQIGTFIGAKLFFEKLFFHSGGKTAAYLGILLYLTCPYRIFVCYDQADFSEMMAWMLMPIYAWAILRLLGRDKRGGLYFAAAAAALAGIGYGDCIYFFIAAGITVIAAVCGRRGLALAAVPAGEVLFLPGLHRLAAYLLTDGYPEQGLAVGTIMSKGYRIGQFFSSYAFREGHPGMGLGIMIGISAGLWGWFVNRDRKRRREEGFFTWMAVLFAVMSTRYFPWDMVQRTGALLLKLVSLVGTPAALWGIASACLCVPAAGAAVRTAEGANRQIAQLVPLLVLTACMGLCVYQCNMLTYGRLPMDVR